MAAAERRYARALFEAAQERNRLEEVQRDLSDFVDAVREVPELRALLRDPVLDRRVKIAALSDVLAGSDELVRNFVLVLTEQGVASDEIGLVEANEPLHPRLQRRVVGRHVSTPQPVRLLEPHRVERAVAEVDDLAGLEQEVVEVALQLERMVELVAELTDIGKP